MIGNKESIDFWCDDFCEKSPLIQHINDETGYNIDHQAKVSQFVSSLKNWILDSLKEILPDDIINSISFIPIPTKNVRDEMISNDG